jgi:hypothetical protein
MAASQFSRGFSINVLEQGWGKSGSTALSNQPAAPYYDRNGICEKYMFYMLDLRFSW